MNFQFLNILLWTSYICTVLAVSDGDFNSTTDITPFNASTDLNADDSSTDLTPADSSKTQSNTYSLQTFTLNNPFYKECCGKALPVSPVQSVPCCQPSLLTKLKSGVGSVTGNLVGKAYSIKEFYEKLAAIKLASMKYGAMAGSAATGAFAGGLVAFTSPIFTVPIMIKNSLPKFTFKSPCTYSTPKSPCIYSNNEEFNSEMEISGDSMVNKTSVDVTVNPVTDEVNPVTDEETFQDASTTAIPLKNEEALNGFKRIFKRSIHECC